MNYIKLKFLTVVMIYCIPLFGQDMQHKVHVSKRANTKGHPSHHRAISYSKTDAIIGSWHTGSIDWFKIDDRMRVKKIKSIKDKDEIKHLYINGYRKKNLPKELWEFRYLKTLSINNSRVETIPNEIDSLKELEHLYIGATNITDLPTKSNTLRKLKSLDIMFNNVDGLSDLFDYMTEITYLNITCLECVTIPSVSNLNKLAFLSINSFAFEEKLISAPIGIEKLLYLEKLQIQSDKINFQMELEKLTELKNLTFLSIPFNKLDEFPPALFELENLEEINARGNRFQDAPEGFKNLTKLKYIDLSSNEPMIPHSVRKKIQKMIPDCEINW